MLVVLDSMQRCKAQYCDDGGQQAGITSCHMECMLRWLRMHAHVCQGGPALAAQAEASTMLLGRPHALHQRVTAALSKLHVCNCKPLMVVPQSCPRSCHMHAAHAESSCSQKCSEI